MPHRTCVEMMYLACCSGDDRVLYIRNLVEQHNLTGEEIRSQDNRIFWAAFMKRHLGVLALLRELFGIGAPENRELDLPVILQAFHYACEKHDIQQICWLRDQCGLTPDDARSDNNRAFLTALRTKTVPLLTALHDLFGIGAPENRELDLAALKTAFTVACTEGDIQVLDTLHRNYGLTDVDTETYKALYGAVSANHVGVINTLYHLYRLVDIDVPTAKTLVRVAVQSNSANSLRTLCELYHVTVTDADFAIYLLQYACTREFPDTVCALRSVLTPEMAGLAARANNCKCLIVACENGFESVLRHLHDSYGLSGDDARTRECYGLIQACENGHAGVLNVLHDVYGLTKEDAQIKHNLALCRAALTDRAEILLILRTKFHLTHADTITPGGQLVLDWAVEDGCYRAVNILEHHFYGH